MAADGTIMTPVSFSATQNQNQGLRVVNEADSSASRQEAYSCAAISGSDYDKAVEDARDMQYVSSIVCGYCVRLYVCVCG